MSEMSFKEKCRAIEKWTIDGVEAIFKGLPEPELPLAVRDSLPSYQDQESDSRLSSQ